MSIVGREEEVNILNQILENDESKFVAVYGRRRVGKTFLIRTTYESSIVFECAGLNTKEENTDLQIENFTATLSKNKFYIPIQPTNWVGVFNYLELYIQTLKGSKKKVIFLDEISWFDTHKSGFLPALSNFWNSFCTKRKDIVLVICGSAASWIINNVVNHKGSLHNRLNRILQIAPFTLSETEKYLEKKKVRLSKRDLALLYMSVGGIPFYLTEIVQGQSLNSIIDSLFFVKNAVLQNEFANLYSSLFENHHNHVAVIKALAKSNSGQTRQAIVQATKMESGGTLTKILEELEQCSFIIKTPPLNNKKVDTKYRLLDEYTIFYLKFLYNKKKAMSANTLLNGQSFKIWSGFAFENLCFRHVPQIMNALGIGGIQYDVFSFVDKSKDGTQIDMIIDRSDNCINMIEAKFHNQKYVMKSIDAENITHKINTLTQKTRTSKIVFTTLITSSPTEKNEYYNEVITNEINYVELFK